MPKDCGRRGALTEYPTAADDAVMIAILQSSILENRSRNITLSTSATTLCFACSCLTCHIQYDGVVFRVLLFSRCWINSPRSPASLDFSNFHMPRNGPFLSSFSRDSWREEAEALSSEAGTLRETVHALRQYSENDTIDQLLGQASAQPAVRTVLFGLHFSFFSLVIVSSCSVLLLHTLT